VYLKVLVNNKHHLTACCTLKSTDNFQKSCKKPILNTVLDITNLDAQKTALFKYSLGGNLKIEAISKSEMQWKQYIKLYFIINNISKSMMSLEASLKSSNFETSKIIPINALGNSKCSISASFNKCLISKIYAQYNLSLCLNFVSLLEGLRLIGFRQDLLFSFDDNERYSLKLKLQSLTYSDLNSYFAYTVRVTHNIE
jgi:hypothetical protein